MDDVQVNSNGDLFYQGDTFKIVMTRYSDPKRLNLARSAAIYLGKSDRDNTRRPLSIIRNGHVGEIFRGEMAEFEFIDVSKEVYDHIVRTLLVICELLGEIEPLRQVTTPCLAIK
jgi:hypothetical protein